MNKINGNQVKRLKKIDKGKHKQVNERYAPFIKDNMTSEDYKLLGQIIIKDKIDSFKFKIRRLFRIDKINKKRKNDQ